MVQRTRPSTREGSPVARIFDIALHQPATPFRVSWYSMGEACGSVLTFARTVAIHLVDPRVNYCDVVGWSYATITCGSS